MGNQEDMKAIWLDGVEREQAGDIGGALTDPSLLVIHYTAGANSLPHLVEPGSPYVSSHFHISCGGRITQCVPLNRIAYHAGRSEWHGKPGVNAFGVGIELENWGPVRRVEHGGEERWYAWPADWSRIEIPAREVFAGEHRNGGTYTHWHVFACDQLVSLLLLARRLFKALPSLAEIVGHDDIAPRRKIDPGPAFPMEFFRQVLTPKGTSV